MMKINFTYNFKYILKLLPVRLNIKYTEHGILAGVIGVIQQSSSISVKVCLPQCLTDHFRFTCDPLRIINILRAP